MFFNPVSLRDNKKIRMLGFEIHTKILSIVKPGKVQLSPVNSIDSFPCFGKGWPRMKEAMDFWICNRSTTIAGQSSIRSSKAHALITLLTSPLSSGATRPGRTSEAHWNVMAENQQSRIESIQLTEKTQKL